MEALLQIDNLGESSNVNLSANEDKQESSLDCAPEATVTTYQPNHSRLALDDAATRLRTFVLEQGWKRM